MKKIRYVIPFLMGLLLFSPALIAQDNSKMRQGFENFQNANYNQALFHFREVLLDESLRDYHGSAYFWIMKSYMAQEDLESAEENLDFFLNSYSGHPFYEEAVYQKGRIDYLHGNYQEAILVLHRFLAAYPESTFAANAYYWIGESLFSLGHYREAEKLFYKVLTDYPASYKVEAANYRLALIDLAYREEVLLNLVKLSHEESVSRTEEFQRRERSYEQAIAAYQRQIRQLIQSGGVPQAAGDLVDELENTDVLELRNRSFAVKGELLELLEELNQEER